MKDEHVWRLANVGKGQDVRIRGSGATRSPSLSSAAKARLHRIAHRTPEVMVKITGRSRGIVHLKQHLDYITRNGRLLGETQDGSEITTRADVRGLHDDWLIANALTERGRPNPAAAQSVGVILSMPAGTPPDRLHEAARTWARESLPNNDWLMVRHEDKDHPHVHVTVRAVGHDGRRLVTSPADLQKWRETFARELRRHGIEAEATPRQARGAVRRSDGAALHRLGERGIVANVVKRRAVEGGQDEPAQQPRSKDASWARSVQQRQQNISDTYMAHAAALDDGDMADRRLARDLRAFVSGMAVPLKRRQAIADSLGIPGGQQEQRPAHQPEVPVELKTNTPPAPSREQTETIDERARRPRRR